MQRLKGRNLLLCALAIVACGVDPTENEGTPTSITANPEVLFVTQGDSQAVIASVVDEDGQILEADFEASNVGSGITVIEDPNYLGTTTGVGIRRQARFFVKAVDLAASSFTLNALGLTKEISVTSVPGNLAATISNLTPLLGDTVTITAPAGTFFTEGSVLTFGGAEPEVVSQDASTIVFIPFPNITGPGVVSDVGVTSNPNLLFTLATPDTLRTDSIPDIGANVTPLTPVLAQVVTLTLPAELRVIPESLVQSGVGADTVPRGLTVAGAEIRPRNITVTPDSLTISFIPAPNSDSFVVVPGVIARRLPQYPLVLATTARVTTPVVDSFPATISSTTPAANAAITLTSTDPDFTFAAAPVVSVGADASPTVWSSTANSITFQPTPGSSGNVSVNGVTIAGFTLNLPSQAPSITVGALSALPGTDDPSTAPAIAVPGPGETVSLFDEPDFAATIDHFYRFDVPAAGNYRLTVDWDIGSDVDAIICTDVTCGAFAGPAPFAAASSAHPESGVFALAAGTNIILVEDFGEDAVGARIKITIERQ